MTKRYCQCGCGGILPNNRPPSRFLRGHHSRVPDRVDLMPAEPPLCQCGCGERIELKRQHRWSGAPRFLSGHGSRVSHPLEGTGYQPTADEIPQGTCECGCGLPTSTAKRTNRSERHFKGHPVPYAKGHNGRTGRGPSRYALQKGVRNSHPKASHPSEIKAQSKPWRAHKYLMVYAPDHPNCRADGTVAQHRLVMEQSLGRFLEPSEEVHNKNGKPSDNRPANLEIWKSSHPAGVRNADYHCPGCRCFEH